MVTDLYSRNPTRPSPGAPPPNCQRWAPALQCQLFRFRALTPPFLLAATENREKFIPPTHTQHTHTILVHSLSPWEKQLPHIPRHTFFSSFFLYLILHSQLPPSALPHPRHSFQRGRSLGRLRLSVALRLSLRAAAGHLAAIASQQQSCTGVCPRRLPSSLFPTLHGPHRCHSLLASRPSRHAKFVGPDSISPFGPDRSKRVQRLLSPATDRPAFAPVGDQSFVRLRFIDRPNSTTAVQSSRSPLSSHSFGPRRVSAFRQCGEVVNLSGHRPTLARRAQG